VATHRETKTFCAMRVPKTIPVTSAVKVAAYIVPPRSIHAAEWSFVRACRSNNKDSCGTKEEMRKEFGVEFSACIWHHEVAEKETGMRSRRM